MKRLVTRKPDGSIVPIVDGEYTKLSKIYAFVADVQDILGDEYDLDQLRELLTLTTDKSRGKGEGQK